MSRRVRMLAAWVIVGLAAGQIAAQTARDATNEILRLVPADVAVCFVVEDLAGHCSRFIDSPFWQQAQQLPTVQHWANSPEITKVAAAARYVSAQLGLTPLELRDRVVGQSIVLAFRPAADPADADTGLAFCRLSDPELAARVVDVITRPTNGRQSEKRQHANVAYVARREANGKRDFVLALGSVAVISDKESAIQQVIDVRRGGRSFGEHTAVQRMRASIPQDALLQILIQPRALDGVLRRAMSPAKPSEIVLAALVQQVWRALDWASLTLRVRDKIEFGFHVSLDQGRLPETVKEFEHRPAPAIPNRFWERLPANALAAASIDIDFPALASLLSRLGTQPDRDLRTALDVFGQMLPGFDVVTDLLPRLGPEFGLAILPRDDSIVPHLLAVLRVEDAKPTRPGELTLHLSIESALRPLLVFVGLEHNRQKSDSLRLALQTADGARIHYFTGSRQLPAGIEPGFALHDQFLMAGSSPAAIAAWLDAKPSGFASSPLGQTLAARFPKSFAPIAFVNVAALRQHLARHDDVIRRLLVAADAKQGGYAAERFERLLSLTPLLDFIVVGSHWEGSVKHWSLALVTSSSLESAGAAAR